MKAENVISNIITLIVFIGILWFFGDMFYKAKKSKLTEFEKYEAYIGNKVVLNKDTLMIIDYSFMNSNFTLEDGKKIHTILLEKLETIK